MRATKHAAPQPWRGRGPGAGISLGLLVLGLLVAGVPVCRDLTARTGSGTGAGGRRQLPRADRNHVLSADASVAQPTGVRFARH